jgi:hypothetical protein
MWPDNETDIDLLGFDFLVDELFELLRDPAILPVTIGVAGDWGSGKSSILKMTANQLRAAEGAPFQVIEFSPWRFEDYADVKAALLEAVLGAVRIRVEGITDEGLRERLAKILKRLALRVKWLPAARLVAAAALKGHTDLAPEQIALITNPLLTRDLEAKQEEALKRLEDEDKEPEEPVSLGAFRETFADLIGQLEMQALVVLVDDLDRCLPDTIINVFEAMRLFLYSPKTAFVVAADQRIVQAAVEHAYPEAVKADGRVSTDYLEKILQLTISIPPLSISESVTYSNLLMAQANTTEEEFGILVAAAQAQRAKAGFDVAMNHGIAAAVLPSISHALAGAFAIASSIAPVLAPKQRGNPRQIKRFLNLFQLRQRAATRRGVSLEPDVLAKMMVLETVAPNAYHTLFVWQAQSAGKPVELARAESGNTDDDPGEAIATWIATPGVTDWLKLDPALAKTDLGPYFFYSRDRLSPALPAARLSPELQALLAELRSDIEGDRTGAVARALALEPGDLAALYPRLLELASRSPAPTSREMRSALDIATGNQAAGELFRDMLIQLPPTSVPRNLVMQLKVAFGGNADAPVVKAVFDAWAKDGSLARFVADARERPKRGK